MVERRKEGSKKESKEEGRQEGRKEILLPHYASPREDLQRVGNFTTACLVVSICVVYEEATGRPSGQRDVRKDEIG